MASQEKIPAGSTKGAILDGKTIKSVEEGLSFEIPARWVKWHEDNREHPNLHLSPSELRDAEIAEGEWDKEFSLVVNAILPFEDCIAHAGSEGWGLKGMSYADLQVRAYVLKKLSLKEVKQLARSKGEPAVTAFSGTLPVIRTQQTGDWQQVVLEYLRNYQDYGAKALVDLRMRNLEGHSVVFAFMYTDHEEQDAAIAGILKSVKFTPPR